MTGNVTVRYCFRARLEPASPIDFSVSVIALLLDPVDLPDLVAGADPLRFRLRLHRQTRADGDAAGAEVVGGALRRGRGGRLTRGGRGYVRRRAVEAPYHLVCFGRGSVPFYAVMHKEA